MHPLFASAALALVAAWPISGLGWTLGKTADRLTGDPEPRSRAWNRAIALPPAVLALMTGVSALPEETTAPVYQAALASGAVATAGAAMNEASVRALSGLNGAETLGGVLILGALGGLAVAATRQVLGRAKLKRIVREARPVSQELALAVRAAARRMDTGRPEVKISDAIDQPLLAGLTTPVILLPADLVARLDVARLVPICAHELAHLKRGDNWRLLAEHLLGGLFWMVPPYAALRARAAATREELADALALEGAAQAVRRTYAETLIDVLRTRAAPALHPAFTGKGRRPTLMRLKAITDPRTPAGPARRAALTLAGLLAVTAAAVGSIALAQQGDGRNGHTRTIVSDSEKGRFLDIESDRVRLTNTEVVDGKPKLEVGQTAVYLGDVRVRGRLMQPEMQVLLNGKPAPADFDPTVLPSRSIQSLEVTNLPGKAPRMVLNFIM
ncbi:M56 family metallopeptidase [Caulobacter sp. RL271]|jgi:beta-lactamase regulating signal transducer with metallopeptidase domain|uniref:Peptidase M56 n=1 Tax=Caulobacter segnis TaxID=88688 RepID=A0ABY4ZW82_9CAUL|nr:M56 family metallopeptidase [Caulobacter segnis]USQ96990.1 peptidase M56 [Caulobacter segnis]